MFRKRAAPAVGEIKDRHVEYEHGVVSVRAWLKNLAPRPPEIVFTLFGFHCLRKILDASPLRTTKPWRDFAIPLLREETKVAM